MTVSRSPLSRRAGCTLGLVMPLGLLPASLVMAQASPELDDMVITATGYEQAVADAPASISVITRESLEERAYRDVTDALSDVPGVVVTGGGDGEAISLRGMPVEYTLFLVDGRRQSTRATQPNGGGGFEKDWLPPLSSIERIEVIRGPMSTLYGSDAIGGVINIITRKVAREWHGNLRTENTVQARSESGNENQQQLWLSGPLVDDALGVQLQAQKQHRQEDDIERGYAERDFTNLAAKLTFTPSDRQTFRLEAQRQDQEYTNTEGRSVPCRGDCEASIRENDHETLALSHEGQWGMATSNFYVQRETARNEGRDIEVRNTVVDSRWLLPLDRHFLTLGGTYEEARLDDSSTNDVSDIERLSASQRSLFAEDEWMLTEAVSVTGGLRLDEGDDFDAHLSPRLYGVWHFRPDWTLKGGVSTGFRAPTLRENSEDWGQESRDGTIYGNPDLDPETSTSHELGLVYQAPEGLDANLTLFYNEFDDKISLAECGSNVCPSGAAADDRYYVNIDEATTQGVEAGMTLPLAEAWELQSGYTYTDSEQRSGEDAGRPLTQVPKHQLNATLRWQAHAQLSTWARYQFRGEESLPTTVNSQRASQAPSYATVDLGGRLAVTPEFSLMVGMYNVFDKRIDYDGFGYVEDGRRYWLATSFDF